MAGDDYEGIAVGSATIAAGNTSTTIDVTVNGDDVVGPADLAIVLGNWGPCL